MAASLAFIRKELTVATPYTFLSHIFEGEQIVQNK